MTTACILFPPLSYSVFTAMSVRLIRYGLTKSTIAWKSSNRWYFLTYIFHQHSGNWPKKGKNIRNSDKLRWQFESCQCSTRWDRWATMTSTMSRYDYVERVNVQESIRFIVLSSFFPIWGICVAFVVLRLSIRYLASVVASLWILPGRWPLSFQFWSWLTRIVNR